MHKYILYPVLLAAILCFGCKEEEEDRPNDGNPPGGLPEGVARVYGTVRDNSGQPASNAQLHVIYQIGGGEAQAEPLVGSSTSFYTTQVLTTECDGSIPLSDGILVQIFWDNDGNGPDADDPQPPLCLEPPNCETGPARTVNYTSFPINGASPEVGVPGTFAVLRNFVVGFDILEPNSFYLRIFCTDGEVLYQSDTMRLAPGPSEINVEFECTQCEGVPVIPQWLLAQSYPNPVEDSVTIDYGLQNAATALLTAQFVGAAGVDTLELVNRNAGYHRYHADLPGFPNGLYEYVLRAGSFIDRKYLLLNTSSLNRVRQQWPVGFGNSDGTYRFDLAAGQSIELRNEANQITGAALLTSVRLLAFGQGTLSADTTFTIASQESVLVDLTLTP